MKLGENIQKQNQTGPSSKEKCGLNIYIMYFHDHSRDDVKFC